MTARTLDEYVAQGNALSFGVTARAGGRLTNGAMTGAIRDEGAAPEGVVARPDQLLITAATRVLVKDCMDQITRRFPGFLWAIQPDERGGVINLFCRNFHATWGYTIRTRDVQDDPKRTEAIKGAMELLRRFRYPVDTARRGGQVCFNAELAAAVPRDGTGMAIPDITDIADKRRKLTAEVELALATGRAEIVVGADGGKIVQVNR